jgi:molybdate transport system regulatory protein
MNGAFAPPLVDAIRGGASGGGAILTQQGRKVLDSFRRLENLFRTTGLEELLVIRQAASHATAEPG